MELAWQHFNDGIVSFSAQFERESGYSHEIYVTFSPRSFFPFLDLRLQRLLWWTAGNMSLQACDLQAVYI